MGRVDAKGIVTSNFKATIPPDHSKQDDGEVLSGVYMQVFTYWAAGVCDSDDAPAPIANVKSMTPSRPGVVRLRPAVPEDAPMLEAWDREPHVIACSSDQPGLDVAFDGIDWPEELAAAARDSFYQIAEVDRGDGPQPIGVMQVCDPHTEPTHYWGEIEPGLKAMDIWIGPPEALNQGYGTQMMTLALDAAFSDPDVKAVVIDPLNSNTAAHRFYRRLGFRDIGRRLFNDEDDCLVMRLERADWLRRAR